MLKITHIYRFGFLQKALLFLGLFLALGNTGAFAQFAVTEDFRGSGNPDIIIGDDAVLTSGNADPVNQGWLRLTNSDNYKKGSAYVNKSFPSSLGVLVDFEFKMWRNIENRDGADGIGVFLFDGTSTFKLGGNGGSMGYTSGNGSATGLAGGYVGIGLDAYGNFANPVNGPKHGGPEGNGVEAVRANAVIMRGPTTTNDTDNVVAGVQPTNRYLAGSTITVLDNNNNNNSFSFDDAATTVNNNRLQNALDFNTKVDNRPSDATYYRRIQIEIERLSTNGIYRISVRWKIKPDVNSPFVLVTSYITTDVPPALLKLGFSAATGGDQNFHEIRNLLVTTPNNVRVIKRGNKEWLRGVRNVSPNATTTDNQIQYTIEINNDTDMQVDNVKFEDYLTDANGAVVPFVASATATPGGFYIETLTPSGFLGNPTSASFTRDDANGKITRTGLSMAANSIAYVTITGRLTKVPAGNLLRNTVTITPQYDTDMNNNTSIVETPVLAEGTDATAVNIVDHTCSDGSNTFTIKAASVGTTNLVIGTNNDSNRLRMSISLPTGNGYAIGANNYNGWDLLSSSTNSGLITYVLQSNQTQTITAGNSYNFPITFTVTKSGASQAYTTTAVVSYLNSGGGSIETTTTNNTSVANVYAVPLAPTVSNVYYCQGDTAVPLTVTKNPTNATGYTFKWYYSASGGFSSDFAPTPSTESAAAQSYWVSQVNGTCEGPRSEIKVFISTTPTAGAIAASQNICYNTPAATITSQTDGTIGVGTRTYRWESSTNNGMTWGTITGATGATYLPTGNQTATILYRRYTVSKNGTGTAPSSSTCESPATNTVTITVSAVPTPGTLTADQSLCYNTPAGAITTASGAANAPTGTGTLTYKWESATATGSFGVITGVSAESYTPPGNNTVTMRYRRSTIATNGAAVCTSAVSNIVTVYVQGTVDPGSITANQTICPGSTPTALTSTALGSSPTPTAAISYRWESSINAGGAWSAAASSTNTVGYTFPGAVSQTTYYRRITISTYMGKACEVPSGNVIITAALPTAGSISANQIICKNSAPALLTSAAGGAGTGAGNPTTYQWYSSNDPVNNFSAIGGANSETYQAGSLGGTTYYLRTTKTTTNGLTCESARTAAIKITVVEFPNPGSLNTPDKYACNGVAPTPITSNIAGSATDGATISYRWQQTTDAAATVWSGDIPGAAATGPDYAPGPLTQTTIFRRYTIATYPNAECRSTAATNEIKVNVSAVPTSGSIKGDQVVCSGTTPNNILNDQQGTGSSGLTYLWQTSTNNVDWNNVSGSNSDYQPPGGITVTTYYRRFGVSSNGGAVCTATVPSNVVTVIVPVTTAGTIAANQTICSGTAPQLLTSAPGGAGTGTNITYKWQVSSNGGAWGDVSANGTGETYQPGNLTVNTQYRRVTTSTVTKGNANCSTSTSNTITITVTAAVIGGTIGSDQAICYNTTPPANLTSSGAINPGTYRWESSTDGNSWSDTGVTTMGYTFTAPLIKTTYYRRVTVSGSCEGVSNTVTIYVAGELTAGSISGNQNICMDSLPGTIGPGTAGGGTGIYYKWEMSVNNGANWSAIANATQASYQPPVIHKTTQYRRTTVSTSVFGAFTVVCESATTAGTVIVTARNCKVITNPMIYQKVKN